MNEQKFRKPTFTATTLQDVLRNIKVGLSDGDWQHPNPKAFMEKTRPFLGRDDFFVRYHVLGNIINN